MKLINNRRFAWIVLAACIAVSIIGFGGGSLAAQRSDAVRIFNEGIDTSFAVRFSMDAYLENCASYAEIMAQEYRLHVDRDSTLAASILEVASIITNDDTINNLSNSYKSLCRQIEDLYIDFHAADVAEADRAIFKNAYSNFQGEVSKIKYDEYHAVAAKFNSAIEGFPANAISRLLNIDALSDF